MLSNAPFYWGSVRKIVESFGVVFADLHIVRTRNNGTVYQTIEVPIEYGPKEKWLVRNTQNPMPGQNDQVEMILPRMSYELMGWQYDASRKLTSTGRTVQALTSNNTVLKAQFNPVPYNFGFDLHVMAKNAEDGMMILEQILPFFGPEYTVNVNDMPELDLVKDVVIVHNGAVQQNDTYEGTFQERRTITWTLSFTVKGYLYPPVKLNKVNLETDIFYTVDGGDRGNLLPSSTVVPDPLTATAINVEAVKETRTDKTVVVKVSPTVAQLNGGDSQTFKVTVVNAVNMDFTVVVPNVAQNDDDTYSTDMGTKTFTYNCGIGTRTTTQVLVVEFISVADPHRSTSVTLILNP